MTEEQSYEGSCLCGAVGFAIRPPTLFCGHCHCAYCRRAHGAAFVTWVGAAEGRFELRDGQVCLVWYPSSKQSRRGFCSKCGTTLFFASTAAPGEMHIARALIAGEIDRSPAINTFDDERVPWIHGAADLPAYGGDAEELAHYRDIPALEE
ncbi:MAG: GFA family protein [Alphaproteobacteria bacterium]|nr:GFA family protein [Alphaproteobacteria bacterium]MDP6566931.1 GFA family protein [Alphaproteobacteria bacterium]MDP6815868.1 GFA family protein [Alphaproteobacteria bacterium]